MRIPKKNRAFTLLELLVSSAILSVLLSSAWFTFTTIQRAANRGNERFSFLKEARRAIVDISRLLSQASPYVQPAKDTGFKGKETSIEFTSLHGRTKDSLQEYVSISLESEGLTVKTEPLKWLLRKKDTAKPLLRNVYPSVAKATFEYGTGKSEQWVKEWDLMKKGKLPSYVRMTLTFNEKNGTQTILEHIIPLRLLRDTGLR